jgi:hypothetical protein
MLVFIVPADVVCGTANFNYFIFSLIVPASAVGGTALLSYLCFSVIVPAGGVGRTIFLNNFLFSFIVPAIGSIPFLIWWDCPDFKSLVVVCWDCTGLWL